MGHNLAHGAVAAAMIAWMRARSRCLFQRLSVATLRSSCIRKSAGTADAAWSQCALNGTIKINWPIRQRGYWKRAATGQNFRV
jgi:hypothetical protein